MAPLIPAIPAMGVKAHSEAEITQVYLNDKQCPLCKSIGVLKLTNNVNYTNPLQFKFKCNSSLHSIGECYGTVRFTDMTNTTISHIFDHMSTNV